MIGGLAAMMGGLLPKIVAELRLAHPRLTFNVTQVLTSPALYDTLRNRTFDLIIGRLPAQPLDADFVSENCSTSRFQSLSEHRASWRDEGSFQFRTFSASRGCFLNSALRLVLSSMRSLERAADAPLLPSFAVLSRRMGAAGDGTVCRRDAIVVAEVRTATKFRRGTAGQSDHQIEPGCIVTLRNRTLTPAARLFIEKTQEVIEPLRKHAS